MTIDIGVAALGYVGYSAETVDGTRVAPTKFLPVTSATFNDSNEYLNPLQIKGSRDSEVAMAAPFVATGSIVMDLISRDMGDIIKSAFAAAVVTSAYSGGGYAHVLTPGNTSGSMSFETGATGGTDLIMSYSGIRINTFQIKATFGNIIESTLAVEGTTRAKQGSAATPSYSASSVYPFHFSGAKVQIGGSDSGEVRDFTFDVNNNVSHIGTLRKTRAYRRIALGARMMTLAMTLDFQDATEYNRLLNDTEFAVQLYLEGPTGVGMGVGASGANPASFTIDLPRVKYKTVGVPLVAGNFIQQDVVCTILKPVGAAICTVTINNPETDAQFAS